MVAVTLKHIFTFSSASHSTQCLPGFYRCTTGSDQLTHCFSSYLRVHDLRPQGKTDKSLPKVFWYQALLKMT